MAGTLLVNGTLDANGVAQSGTPSSAGGSIWITGGCTLSGNGEIQAYGGAGDASAISGGGGGHISIDDTVTYQYTGNLRAGFLYGRGGNGESTGGGSPGTLYLPATARANFTIVSNQWITIGNQPGGLVFGNLTVKGAGTLEVGGDCVGLGTGSVIYAQNLMVENVGKITAQSMGWPRQRGPAPYGAGGIGATHGGKGWLNTNALFGSVTAPVNFGSAGYLPSAGAIKLVVASNLVVNGTIDANGKSHNSSGAAGGSIWITGGCTLTGNGQILAYGGDGGVAPASSGGGGRISIDDTVTYAFGGNIQTGFYRKRGSSPGTVYLPAAARANFTVVTNQTITVGSNTEYVFGNLTVQTGATFECGSWLEGYGTGCVIRANNIRIDPWGKITATEQGFPSYGGPGGAGGSSITGATHAGVGYTNTTAIYGSPSQPTSCGSGGGYWGWQTGGGAIKFVVANSMTVDGTLSADGFTDHASYGAGAGGSIWIDTKSLAGTGKITANGAAQTYGGGGGRVAIKYVSSSFVGLPAQGLYTNQEVISATVTAKGGYHTGADGVEDGSIFISRGVSGSMFVVR